MSSRVHGPSFWWLWASTVMRNKHNVNQPSRSSTINANTLLFCMDHISLRQGHLSLLGARTCFALWLLQSDYANTVFLCDTTKYASSFSLYWFQLNTPSHLHGHPQQGNDHRKAPPLGSLASHPPWRKIRIMLQASLLHVNKENFYCAL